MFKLISIVLGVIRDYEYERALKSPEKMVLSGRSLKNFLKVLEGIKAVGRI